MYRQKITGILIAVVLLSTIALGCISEEEKTPAPTTAAPTTAAPTTAAPYPATVKIGCCIPSTGAMASAGADQRKAIEFAVWIVNNYIDNPILMGRSVGLENLGGAKVVTVYSDSGCAGDLGQQAAEALVAQHDDLVAIYGALCSSATATVANVAEKYGIPMLNGDSSSPKLTEFAGQWDWFFRTSPHDGLFIKTLFDFMKDMNDVRNEGIETLALLYEDTEFGSTSAELYNQYADEYGFEVIEDIPYSRNTIDLDSEVQRIKAANPDVILQAGYVSDSILFAKTLKKYEVNIPVLANDSGVTKVEFMALDESMYFLSRAVFTADMFAQMPGPQWLDAKFREFYGQGLADWTRCVMGVLTLCDAINRAGSTDPDAVRQALLETDISPEQLLVPWKGIKFDPGTHQNIYGAGIICQAFEVDGKIDFYSVWPFDVAGYELVWPPTPWDER